MKGNLIVILNDNDMSISVNVGSFATNLSKIRSRRGYFRFKDWLAATALKIPLVGKQCYRFFQKIKQGMKSIYYQGNIFEDLGFYYLGPVDGHNQQQLERVLNRAKDLKKPCLIHAKTTKGKGYSYAEDQPTDFHGIGSFVVETGEHGNKVKPDFSEVFGDELCLLAKAEPRICAITAAMGSGCGLTRFSETFPERFFDVGIAEQHALTFAGGLAKNGMKPVFAVYSSFLQRGFDQIIHDLALQGISVTIGIDRAGIVGEDGETHQGLFDIPMLLPIPGISIYSPATYGELRQILRKCMLSESGVSAIRYPRGFESDIVLPFCANKEDVEWLGTSEEICMISYGRQVVPAIQGIREANRDVSFLKLNRIFPIEDQIFEKLIKFKKILLVEECYQRGGIGEYVGNRLMNLGYQGVYRNFGIENTFLKAGKPADLLRECRLDGGGIAARIAELEAL